MFLSDELNQIVEENKHNNRMLSEKINITMSREIQRIGKIENWQERNGCVQRAKNALKLALRNSNFDTSEIEWQLNRMVILKNY